MHYFLYLVPMAVLFLSPWIHHLSFENIKAAVPMSDDAAHAWSVGLSIAAFIASIFVAEKINKIERRY